LPRITLVARNKALLAISSNAIKANTYNTLSTINLQLYVVKDLSVNDIRPNRE
jgi:hypothetical protein